jgi:hypothetical protein
MRGTPRRSYSNLIPPEMMSRVRMPTPPYLATFHCPDQADLLQRRLSRVACVARGKNQKWVLKSTRTGKRVSKCRVGPVVDDEKRGVHAAHGVLP